MSSLRLALFGWVMVAGCVLGDVPLEGKDCPCARGFVCNTADNVCVREVGTLAVGEACGVDTECASGICDRDPNQCAGACDTEAECLPDQDCIPYELDGGRTVTICR